MPIGTLTRVFQHRGFGYITPDEGDRDVLVDAALIAAQDPWLKEGRRVAFEAVDNDRGLCAVSIRPCADQQSIDTTEPSGR
jgi:cold shock CspA family protein